MFSIGAGNPGTFQGMFAFQQRQASLKCWRMVLDLFALTPCVATRDREISEERGGGVTRRLALSRGRRDAIDAAAVP